MNTPPGVLELLAKFNAAIEAVARRSEEIGGDEWYDALTLNVANNLPRADAELIALCSPANLHVLCHYLTAPPPRAPLSGEVVELIEAARYTVERKDIGFALRQRLTAALAKFPPTPGESK